MKKIMIDTIEQAFLSDDRHVIRAATNACRFYKSTEYFDKWWSEDIFNYKLGACFLARNGYLPSKNVKAIINDARFKKFDTSIGKELLLRGFSPRSALLGSFPPEQYAKYYTPELLKKFVSTTPASSYVVKKWLESDKWYEKCLGLYSVIQLGDISYYLFSNHLYDIDKDVRDAAIDAVRAFCPSPQTIAKGYLEAKSITDRVTWMRVAAGRKDVVLPLVPCDMDFSEIQATKDIYIPHEICDAWLRGSANEKAVALYSLMNEPNVPYVVINRSLHDESPLVHETALILASTRNYPAYREFEPAEPVYKKCIGEVLVKARIPLDAEIRGDARKEARSNLAIITDIEGTFFGEPVGISFYDATTQYRKGNFVKIDDFDYSFNDCTTGFHFFSERKLAEKYYY